MPRAAGALRSASGPSRVLIGLVVVTGAAGPRGNMSCGMAKLSRSKPPRGRARILGTLDGATRSSNGCAGVTLQSTEG
jgi:hypothetical protein